MTALTPAICPQARLSAQASCSSRCMKTTIQSLVLSRRQGFRLGKQNCLICASYREPDYSGTPQQQQEAWGPGTEYAPPRTSREPPRLPPDGPNGPGGPEGDGKGGMRNITKAFVAGAFILGMGAGIWFDSEVTFEPQNVASTVLVDTKTPNSELCMANGYSSMVFDQRIFVSFNPFNVYVSQPEVKPGCVLRRSNVNVLESRGLVDSNQVQACKRNMNTFAFVGDLKGSPEVSCVYHSEEAENQFLRDPAKMAAATGQKAEES